MKIKNLFKKKGQSLVEIIISVAIGTLIIGSAIGALIITIQSNLLNRNTNFASTLGQDLLDNVGSIAEGNWAQIYEMPKGIDLYLAASKKITNESDLTGTVYVNSGSININGTGTFFTTELVLNDFIDISGRIYKVSLITNDVLLTLASPYTGSNINPPGIKAVKLIGTATVVNGSADVTGVGTAFSTDLASGDYIKIAGQIIKVSLINSNTSLTLTSNYPGTAGEGLKIYREFGIRSGAEDIIPSGSNITYARSFVIENVNRGNCGTGSITTNLTSFCSSINNINDILGDPSTQKITSKVTWPEGSNVGSAQFSEYLTRSKKNETIRFSDWSGASGVEGPFTQPNSGYSLKDDATIDNNSGSIKIISPETSGWLISSTYDTGYLNGVAFNSVMWKGSLGIGANTVKLQFASSNFINGASGDASIGDIDSIDRFAWNDIIGWLDFYNAPGGPSTVTVSKMTRWATSADGDFALDCASTPSGNVCGASNFFVSNNAGNLAGWAWNDAYGWISFCGNATEGSTWDGSTWVCPATPIYQVTINQINGEFAGWAWNDLIGWISFCGGESTANCPGTVAYKVKVETPGSDAWNYIGPDNTPSSFYILTNKDVSVPLVITQHNNKRYYRYKIYLETDNTSHVVDDVIVNWSP